MDKGIIKKKSTDVHKEVTNPLQKDAGKRELDNLEIKEKRKKQKKDDEKSDRKERKKTRKAVKELIELMKELKEIIESKPDDLPVISFRRVEKAPKPEPRDECNFGNKDHLIDFYGSSFIVRGFDTSLPREEIKKSLRKHFESRGFQVKTVYVPITCATGLSFGYAFIGILDCFDSDVLELHGSQFEGGRILHVEPAKFKAKSLDHPDVVGCVRCATYMPWIHRKRPTMELSPSRRYWWTIGTPYSQIGRFTANLARIFN